MIIRAPRLNNNFYILDKHISEDSRLSWAARGLLIYLLGKPDDWHVQIGHLVKQTSNSCRKTGRDGVYVLIEELMEVGYVTRMQNREDGKFQSTDYLVHETPQIQQDDPHPDLPDTANPPQISTDTSPKTEKTTNHLAPSPDALDLARQLLVATLDGGGLVKNPRGWVLAVASRLDAQGGLAAEDTALLSAAANQKAKNNLLPHSNTSPPKALPAEVVSPAWEKIKFILSEKLSEADQKLWIEPLICVLDEEASGKLILAGPDPYFCSWVRDYFLPEIMASLPNRLVTVEAVGSMQLEAA